MLGLRHTDGRTALPPHRACFFYFVKKIPFKVFNFRSNQTRGIGHSKAVRAADSEFGPQEK
jgi:hypothetical protein